MLMQLTRLSMAVGALVAGILVAGAAGQGTAACEPDGDVQFLCGPSSPEDLLAVPRTPLVLGSSMEVEGHLFLADTRDHTTAMLFPAAGARTRHDTALYGACPGPPTARFQPHGLGLRQGDGDIHTLYVVGHGDREAVEVFWLDMGGAQPLITWVGCVVAPEGVGLNSVTSLPGGGFAATNFSRPVGEVWEWRPGIGWSEVPGSTMSGPNGLLVSEDGRWYYIGGWGTQSVVRLSRGATPVDKSEVNLGFHVDNLRWTPDGSLLAAGQGADSPDAIFDCVGSGACDGLTARVARVDPDTLAAEEIVNYPSTEGLIIGTGAIEVGNEIWVGGAGGGDRIGRFPR